MVFFWLAFFCKTFIDGIAGWLHLEKDIREETDPRRHWSYQGIFAALAAAGLLGIKLWG